MGSAQPSQLPLTSRLHSATTTPRPVNPFDPRKGASHAQERDHLHRRGRLRHHPRRPRQRQGRRQAAAKKLADAKSYAWTARDRRAGEFEEAGDVDGKAEKEGFAIITLNFANNSLKAVKKGEKGVRAGRGMEDFAELKEAGGGQPAVRCSSPG